MIVKDIYLKFHDRYIPEPNSGCWIWLGKLNDSGYGMIFHDQKEWRAHRISYEIHNDDYNSNLCVLHSCDVRCCVNPSHLRQGTRRDNAQDKMLRRRTNHGVKSPTVKLSEEQVKEIRIKYESGSVYQKDLADHYKVDQALISRIVNRTIWRYI